MSKIRVFLTLLLVVVTIGLTLAWTANNRKTELPIVAITQIATHPALDEVRQGIIDGLREKGYSDGENLKIVFKNANGDGSLTVPIAQEFIRMKPAVIVPISTPSALAIASNTRSIPIVFSGVTDPVGVGLVIDLKSPGANITGVTDEFPYEDQVKTFKKLFPEINSIGMLYTRGDDVSTVGVRAMEELSKVYEFNLRLAPVSAPQDVYPVAVSLFRRVDAIYTGIDHLLLENMDGLVKASREANKPLLGGESGSVEKGAVASVSINMTDFGKRTSELIVKVLEGAEPGSLPVEVINEGRLIVNENAATTFGLNLNELRDSGAKIIN